jgi:hypothetical protein
MQDVAFVIGWAGILRLSSCFHDRADESRGTECPKDLYG